MFYRQPRYFIDFHCIGGTCPNSCCENWSIDWTQEEIDKVKNAPNCSPELRDLCENSFEHNEERKVEVMKLDDKRRCPFLTDDNFCKIQRELGAEYLSNTCTVYPRHYIVDDPNVYRFCGMSCPEIMRRLLNDEKCMDLVNVPIKQELTIKWAVKNNPQSLEKHPELEYRSELLEFFYDIIADKKLDVENNIVLGALAAQSLSKLVENKGYDRIPEALKTLRSQTHSGANLKTIENIKPNYNVKLGILGSILKSPSMQGLIDKENKLNIDLYIAGEHRLAETFKDRPFYLRNIALNLLFEFVLPFKFTDMTIFENYAIFATAFALLKLNTIATAELTKLAERSGAQVVSSSMSAEVPKLCYDTEQYVNKSAALISRTLCHNVNNAKSLLEFLKDKKMTSPAYLALLIK